MRIIILNNDMLSFVDDEDYEELNKFKWTAHINGKNYYADRHEPITHKTITMHRHILKFPVKGIDIDHIDGNGLNNQKSNLRMISHRENGQNLHNVKKTSKYPGVFWSKIANKWSTQIRFGKGKRHIGNFDNEIDAASAYRVACVYLTGKDPVELKS